MPGKCKFNPAWLEKEVYKNWLLEDPKSVHRAQCKICSKSLEISNMGESALKSHMQGERHVNAVGRTGSTSVREYFTPTVSKQQNPQPTTSSGVLDPWVRNNDTWRAEILWTLKGVTSHYSNKSAENNSALFQLMFPDSVIAKSFACGEKKTSYMVNYGIAPYVKLQLLEKVKTGSEYVLLFDESLNKELQLKQMDVHIRFLDAVANKVSTHYLDSAFMGHGKAEDCLKHFKHLTEELNLSNLLQISMDGPNVNHKFYRDFQISVLAECTDKQLIDIGTCSLHSVHNAFRNAFSETNWHIDHQLLGFYRLFHDTPARRDDYVTITGCSLFPKKFCSHRWVENVEVASRALEVLPHLRTFVKTIEADKNFNTPKCKTFTVVKEACKDPLFPAKLHFFVYLAKHVQGYLQKYQTDRPMIPFMTSDWAEMISAVMSRVLKTSVTETMTDSLKMSKYEIKDEDALGLAKVDIGFSTDRALKQIVGKVSEKRILEFRSDARRCLLLLLRRLLDKTPIRFSFVRQTSCLNPNAIAQDPDGCERRFKRLLNHLVELKRFPESKCDDAQMQYKTFIKDEVARNISRYREYDIQSHSLDHFFSETLQGKDDLKYLWQVVKMVLILSHGQATVERGFSVNAAMSTENKKEISYASQRLVCDYVSSVGGVKKVQITPRMIASCKAARQRYEDSLIKQREIRAEKTKCRDQEEERRAKKRRLESDIAHLELEIEKAANEAETSSKPRECIIRFNSFRKSLKDKKDELKKIC
nr:uncharacterized protein LOC129422133 [Misgurnus anguillicaudatus]